MNDVAHANLAKSRRHAVILWELIGRPFGRDCVETIQSALEQSTDEQVVELLKYLKAEAHAAS